MATIEQVAAAFVNGHKATSHNSRTDGAVYWLHGHPIAVRRQDGYEFSWCGWYTNTTTNHMNAILRELAQRGIVHKDHRYVSAAKARDAGQESFRIIY